MSVSSSSLRGARDCTIEALDILKTDVEAAERLIMARPEMTSIYRAITACLGADEPLEEAAERIKQEIREASAKIAEKAALLPSTGDQILTHSGSGTVFQSLVAAYKKQEIEVVATESRPLFEGRLMAETLAKEAIHTTLVTDAAGSSMLPYCQAMWVGADTVGKDFFVNKVGTLPLALAAKHFGVPVYVLCDSWKFLPENREYRSRGHHSGDEVDPMPLEHLRVLNPYFEKIPLDLVTEVITELPK